LPDDAVIQLTDGQMIPMAEHHYKVPSRWSPSGFFWIAKQAVEVVEE
jgi:hypothetical protein